jgi:CRP/FNR family cyclic AMP-dependent transcriptional regulator
MHASRLASVPLFSGLTPEELERCAAMFEETEMLAGSGMIREGDFSYRFFVVLEGHVDVLRDFEAVATLGPGDYFGEAGVLTGERRNARVVAKDRCVVGRLMGWDFKQMADQFPSIADHVRRTIAERTPDDH